ncbi:MAG: putative metal-binding motif-containing protein [Deltaproteobacteria bacterium]|nr:putative metal-binding motif-containing protein [Deltaproteobacteria bacterium]
MRLTLLFALALVACKDDGSSTTDSGIPPADSGADPDNDGDGVPASEDCDDNNPDVSPSAAELCDGLDNNCDGETDEGVLITFYADADADGYGDITQPTDACEQPSGAAATGDDCDDTNPAIHPNAEETDCADPTDYNCDGSTGFADADNDGWPACQDCDDGDAGENPDAVEICDESDDDCDGLVDEDVTTTFWADTDADSYGDLDFPVESCALPDGYAVNSEDCDDSDALVNPGITEICDERDDDCDGDIDEGVTTTYYSDIDGDGFGDLDAPVEACEVPSGFVINAEDCDDTDADISPEDTELCDGVDNDCDSAVDEPDALDAAIWYADDDGDLFGDASASTSSCEAPSGFVDDDSDCDDSDAATFPGAAPEDDAAACMTDADDDDYGDDSPSASAAAGSDCDDADATVYPGGAEDGGDGSDAGDGLDNDCDGYDDEGLLYGSGGDGEASVTSDTAWEDLGGACTVVSAVSGGAVTVSDASDFAVGDKALLVNLQGSSGKTTNVGAWELLDVASVSGATVSFVTSPTRTYGATSNTDLSGQSVALFRVPQLLNLSLGAGATITGDPFDGDCGGVVALLVASTARISGTISAEGLGYAGGAQNTTYASTGQSGEGTTGAGSKTYLGNGTGGGGGGLSASSCSNCEGNGGGGGHATAGEAGEQSNPTLGYGGVGGTSYGDVALLAMTLGSGGGAGALDQSTEKGIGGSGGAGGGALVLYARNLTVLSTGLLTAAGEDGEAGCAEFTNWCGTAASGSSASEAEAGGAGAGGSLYVASTTAVVSPDTLGALGGLGQLSGSSWAKYSGDGGDGRVRLDLGTLNGVSAASAATEAAAVCEPDPGTIGAL